MVTLQVSFEDLLKAIDNLPEEQKRIIRGRLNLTEANDKLEARGVTDQLPKRIAGLGEGTIWMSDDFTDPLPDEFWLGEDP